MIEPLRYQVSAREEQLFLREILQRQFSFSHALLTQLKQQQKIRVNGQVRKTNYRVRGGDWVQVDLNLAEENWILPQAFPLEILYEDEDFLVLNKPAGLAVHPAKSRQLGTLANRVIAYWQQKGQIKRFRPMNRLDKDTSGVILIGQSQYAHQSLDRELRTGQIRRSYWALVEGQVKQDGGQITAPLYRADSEQRQWCVDVRGKPAHTHYQVLARYPKHSLLQLRLATGRTHQIRVHLQFLGYPLCGDTLYGDSSPFIARQALHAGDLGFTHPRTQKEVAISAPLPQDFQQALEKVSVFLPDKTQIFPRGKGT